MRLCICHITLSDTCYAFVLRSRILVKKSGCICVWLNRGGGRFRCVFCYCCRRLRLRRFSRYRGRCHDRRGECVIFAVPCTSYLPLTPPLCFFTAKGCELHTRHNHEIATAVALLEQQSPPFSRQPLLPIKCTGGLETRTVFLT